MAEQDTTQQIKDTAQSSIDDEHLQILRQQSRHQLIEETAYHLAEERGFNGEHALDDWLTAEVVVDTYLGQR